MSKIPFREHHLLSLLEIYEKESLPLDLIIHRYFKEHKALGSKDRGYIAETIYGIVRWKGLLDYLCENPVTWEKRLRLFEDPNFNTYKNNPSIPLPIRVSFPQALFERIVHSYNEQEAIELCLVSNTPAPTTIRINPLKTTREFLLQRWQALYEISPCPHSELGIIFHKKIHFYSLQEFKDGLFEVQDEGSQLLSLLVNPCPGDLILDYCAGSGGKTLAFAHRTQQKGQIFLHDVRPHVLQEARKRLRRAGVQNAQWVIAEDPKLKKLKKRMDWVVVDAPCSGTGTMRRNPDMKWQFTEEMLKRLVGQQRTIFEKALSYLKPSGRIMYGTCSILKEENEEQLAHFLKTYDLQVEGEVFKSLPSEGGMDGFYGVIMKRNPCP